MQVTSQELDVFNIKKIGIIFFNYSHLHSYVWIINLSVEWIGSENIFTLDLYANDTLELDVFISKTHRIILQRFFSCNIS